MIVGKDFIWLHFPKTGGSHIERVLRKHYGKDKDIKFDEINIENVIWHHGIDQRKAYDSDFDASGKKIICGFRRLPYWLLSRVFFEYSRSPEFIVKRNIFCKGEFDEGNGKINKADVYARIYNKNVSYWIRTENLRKDFISVFSNFLDLSVMDVDAEFLRKTNKNLVNYIKDVSFYFTSQELEELYNRNPIWAEIETNIYGDILRLPGDIRDLH